MGVQIDFSFQFTKLIFKTKNINCILIYAGIIFIYILHKIRQNHVEKSIKANIVNTHNTQNKVEFRTNRINKNRHGEKCEFITQFYIGSTKSNRE